MKIVSDTRKYDFINIHTTGGVIENCLVCDIVKDGFFVYPIEGFIKEVDFPKIIPKLHIKNESIMKIETQNFKLLFFAVNARHTFVREALEYHMKYAAESRKN